MLFGLSRSGIYQLPSQKQRQQRRPYHPVFETLEAREMLDAKTPVLVPTIQNILSAFNTTLAQRGENQAIAIPGIIGQSVATTFVFDVRNAGFRSEMGLFVVDDIDGTIAGKRPRDEGYAQLAMSRRQLIFNRTDKPGTSKTLHLPGGKFFALYLVQNTTGTDWLRRNPTNAIRGKLPNTFFSIKAANPDKFGHVRWYQENRVGFEDLTGGGDRDFDDVIARFQFATPPLISAGLVNDTAPGNTKNTDRITRDPTLAGQVTSSTRLTSLQAKIAGRAGTFFNATSRLGTNGRFTFDKAFLTQLNGGALPDGSYQVSIQGTTARGVVSSPFTTSFTLDTTSPLSTLLLDPGSDTSPQGDGQTTLSTISLIGTTEPRLTVRLNTLGRTTTADASGRFVFSGVSLILGTNSFSTTTEDIAGNSTTSTLTITRLNQNNGFENGLADWSVAERGGSSGSRGSVSLVNNSAQLQEGSSFVTTLSRSFVIPSGVSTLSFTYELPSFDTSATAGTVKDAFEVALVNAAGQPLVTTIGAGRDSFFNLTEGQSSILGSTATANGRTVSLDLSSVASGTTAILVFRLVNNDTDTLGNIVISSVTLPTATTGQVLPTKFFLADSQTDQLLPFTSEGIASKQLSLTGNTEIRGVAANAAGTRAWVIDNVTKRITVVDPTAMSQTAHIVGSWIATDTVNPQGITVAGNDLWLVDSTSKTVRRYDAGVSRLSGSAAALSSFQLSTDNASPSDLVSDGTIVWVTDDDKAQVFVYSVGGTLLGRWQLDAENLSPSGITIAPDNSGDLWVLDRSVRTVFHYPTGRSLRSGSMAASGSFGVTRPGVHLEGLADPLSPNAPTLTVGLSPGGNTYTVGSQVTITGQAVAQQGPAPRVRNDGFNDISKLTLVGNAQTLDTADGKVVRLARNTFSQVGGVFAADPVSTRSFNASFSFRVTDRGGTLLDGDGENGADGFGFILRPTTSNPGTPGGGLGIDGLTPSVAVEFDTFRNLALNDPDSNHLGIDINGNVNHGTGAPFTARIVPDFDNGDRWYAWIDYDGTNLEVRVNRSPVRPASPQLTRPVDIPAILGEELASVGVTASTGLSWGNHDLLAWQYTEGTAPSENRIVNVTVNGTPVESLGSDGRFANHVDVTPGTNLYSVVATDLYGQSTTSTLTLTGQTSVSGSVDFSQLNDLSSSFGVNYARTSFNAEARTLFADMAIENQGNYSTHVPLYVAIANLSDPSVRVLDASGVTPEGLPYYDFTGLVTGGTLNPSGLSGQLSLQFLNPSRSAFTYDLKFFGQLNRPPAITSIPLLEATVARQYTYQAVASDPDNDSLHFEAVTAPSGFSVNATTGLISWLPTSAQIGTHPIILRVVDGHGGNAEQQLTIEVLPTRPNRPPTFVSLPQNSTVLGTLYNSTVLAEDLDSDTLVYRLVAGPTGMTIHPATGTLAWNPTISQLGDSVVTLEVDDLRGGKADVTLSICVDTANRSPRIISTPLTTTPTAAEYTYQVMAFDPENDLLQFRLDTSPTGMTIDVLTGIIHWQTPANTASVQVSIRVSDPYGNEDQQIFTLNAINSRGTIRGGVFNDLNGNGLWERGGFTGNIPHVVFAIDDSLSTRSTFQGTPVGDLNNDGLSNTIFDAEIASILLVNQRLIDLGLGGDATISIIRFSGSASHLDLVPNLTGIQKTTYPSADLDGNGMKDVEQSLRAMRNSFGTVFKPPLTLASQLFLDLGTAFQQGTLIFMSDGASDDSPTAEGALIRSQIANVRAYGIGTAADLTDLKLIDPNAIRVTSTDQLLDVFKGQDAEKGLPNRRVYLDANGNGHQDIDERSTLTDSRGLYAFDRLPAGTYTIRQEMPLGWSATGVSTKVVQLTDGQDVPDMSFGNRFIYSAQDNLVLNGSFELGTNPGTRLLTLTPGSTLIDNWSVLAGEIDYQGTAYLASDGTRTIDLVGIRAGTISQTLPTVPGQTYQVFFDAVANPDGGPPERLFEVSASTSQSATFTARDRGETPQTLTWTTFDWLFTATSTSTPLSFRSLANYGSYGPFLDNVRVFPVDSDEPLVLHGQSASSVKVGDFYRLDSYVTGAIGQTTFELVTAPAGMTVQPTTGIIAWLPASNHLGQQTVVLRAQDSVGKEAILSFTITVEARNQQPVITSSDLLLEARVNSPFTYQFRAVDPEGLPLSYQLQHGLPGMMLNAATGQFDWTPMVSDLGNRSITLIVSDGIQQVTQDFTITVLNNSGNSQPVIESAPRTQTAINTPYLYQLQVRDMDHDPLSYALSNAPAGMSISPAGLIRWTPNASQLGSFPVSIVVEDGRGGSVLQSFSLEVNSELTNSAPFISVGQQPSAVVGREYTLSFRGNDPEHDQVFWSLPTAPAGAIIDPVSGLLLWTPTAEQLGLQSFTVQASDSLGATSRLSFVVTVSCLNQAPQIESRPPTSVAVGETYYYAVRAIDPENDILTYSLRTQPAGMTIDPVTGLIQWSPTTGQAGDIPVVIVVDDNQGNRVTQAYSIRVLAQPVNAPPRITSTPNFYAQVATTYQYQVTGSDPEGESLRFGFAAPTPAGMSIDPVSGLIRWTPTASQTGQQTIAISVRDASGGESYQTYVLTVRANRSPQITSTPRTSATPSTNYLYGVVATDPDLDDLSYRLDVAPTGMRIDDFGRIEWTVPATGTQDVPVTVVVRDNYGGEASQSFVISMVPDRVPPTVQLLVSETVINVGSPVQFQVIASDNVGVVSRTLTVAGIPLDLTGNQDQPVSYTINSAGLVEVVATATDAAGNTTSTTKQIRVINPQDPVGPKITILAPAADAKVRGLVDVVATITSTNAPLEYYKVFLARADLVPFNQFNWDYATQRPSDPDYREIGYGTTTVTSATIATLDSTLLQNDEYILSVVAFNTNGQGWQEPQLFQVDGGLKLGNFRQEFTDLTIPLAGIPITITRTYDTLEANEQGDFGYGWRMGMRDARIRETVPQQGDGFFTSGQPFRYGTKVYLNNPDGERIGLTFKPENRPNAFFSNVWIPKFVPDPGVYEKLDVPAGVTLQQQSDGTFAFFLIPLPYNPDDYILTTQDGTSYAYNQQKGLQKITDRNGNTVTFRDDGIFHSSGASIQFIRDGQKRITQIIDPDGKAIRYSYDALGDLRSVADQKNLVTTMTYRSDRPHYLEELRDPLGNRSIRTEYDDQGRIKAIIDATGNRVEPSFDAATNTERIRDARGNITTLVYNDRGQVIRSTDPVGNLTLTEYADPANPDKPTKVTDSRGFITLYQYDAQGNITRQTDALGGVWTYTYGAFNKLERMVDPLGRITTNIYNAKGNLLQSIDALGNRVTNEYDSQGRMTRKTDARGNATLFAYTTSDQPTTITYPDGNSRTISYTYYGAPTVITDERGYRLHLFYDTNGLLLRTIDPEGGTTQFAYNGTRLISETNPRGYTTAYEYDAAERLTKETDSRGGVKRYTYDANGDLSTETDQLGRVTTYLYRADRKLEKTIDAKGGEIRFEYDGSGNLSSEIDALDRRHNYEYDALNRLIRFDEGPEPDEFYRYDAVGNWLTYQNKRGYITAYAYDGLNRLVAETDALGGISKTLYDANGNVIARTNKRGFTTNFAFDQRDRLVKETDPTGAFKSYGYDATSNRISTTDEIGKITIFAFDGMSRVKSVTDALGNISSYVYDLNGNQTSITDPLGRTKTLAYDELDRIIRETDPRGAVVAYGFDLVGNQTTVTDPLNNITRFGFDELNRVITVTDPNGKVTSHRYDLVSNRIETVDRNGRKRTFVFDELDRQTAEIWWDSLGASIRTMNYGYDSVGNLVNASDPDSNYVHTYDALNRLVTVDNQGSPGMPRVILNYTYDVEDNRIGVIDDSGVRVDSIYDSRNLLTTRTWQGGTVPASRIDFGYDARGLNTSINRSSDLTGGNSVARSSMEYDALQRYSLIEHRDATDSIFSSFGFSYDRASQLTREVRPDTSIDYQHDLSGQLTSADRSQGVDESFAYDLGGNRQAAGIVIGVGNRLLSDSTYNYTYDDEGNQVSKTDKVTGTRWEYAYDYRNRLISATERSPGNVILNQETTGYDVLDRRTTVTTNGTEARTAYDNAQAWVDVVVTTATYFLYGDNIDQVLVHATGANATWYVQNQIGSIVGQLTDQTTQTYDYSSFGLSLTTPSPEYSNRFRFTGREQSYILQEYFYRARRYSPNLGRFMSEDPLIFSSNDHNMYRYVFNNPLVLTDPTGLFATEYSIAFRQGFAGGFASGHSIGAAGVLLDFVANLLNKINVYQAATNIISDRIEEIINDSIKEAENYGRQFLKATRLFLGSTSAYFKGFTYGIDIGLERGVNDAVAFLIGLRSGIKK